MKAMIFAAGLGTRLKPITDTIPKALVTINEKPLLEIVIEKLKKAGFKEIIINVHHFAEQIIQFLDSKKNFDIKIMISDETNQLLDTGGGIKKAATFFNDNKPFLVHNVDILSNVDLEKFYNYAIHNDARVYLLTNQRISSRYLLFNENNHLVGWINADTGKIKSPYKDFNPEKYSKYAFGGIHILSPSLFKLMGNPWLDRFSIIDFYLSVCNIIPITAYTQTNLELIDVGKIEILNYLNKKKKS